MRTWRRSSSVSLILIPVPTALKLLGAQVSPDWGVHKAAWNGIHIRARLTTVRHGIPIHRVTPAPLMKLTDDDPPNGPTKDERISLRDVGVCRHSPCSVRNHR